MPKKRVDLMLEPELLEQVDQRAASLRWSRTTFVTAALENYLDDASRGVPDLPTVVSTASPRVAEVRRQEVARKPVNPAAPVVPGVVRARELTLGHRPGCDCSRCTAKREAG